MEPVTSVQIVRERNTAKIEDNRFLRSLGATYPHLVPANDTQDRWAEHSRQLAEHRNAPLKLVGPIGKAVIAAVAKEFNTTSERLVGVNRSRPIVEARHTAMRSLLDLTWQDGTQRFSMVQVGLMFGRDHSTVCHAMNVFDDKARHSPKMAEVRQKMREAARAA